MYMRMYIYMCTYISFLYISDTLRNRLSDVDARSLFDLPFCGLCKKFGDQI